MYNEAPSRWSQLFYSTAYFKRSYKWDPRLNYATAIYFPCSLDSSLSLWSCVFKWEVEIQSDVHFNDVKWVNLNKTHRKVLAWWLFPSASTQGRIILLVHIHFHCVLSSPGTHIHKHSLVTEQREALWGEICAQGKNLKPYSTHFPEHICENIGLLWLLIYITLKAKTESVSILSYFPEIV